MSKTDKKAVYRLQSGNNVFRFAIFINGIFQESIKIDCSTAPKKAEILRKKFAKIPYLTY